MKAIKAQFEVVKVGESQYDVLVFSKPAVLKSFGNTYPNMIYIEKSKFGEQPMVVIPSFNSNLAARTFTGYWEKAFANPDEACQTCAVVQEFFKSVAEYERGDRND